MIKKIFYCLMVLSFTVLSGCAATPIALSQQNSRLIHTVYINPHMKKPEKMYTFLIGDQFGLLSSAIARSVTHFGEQFVEENHIDIKNIIHQQWAKQLRQKTQFNLSPSSGDTNLITEITMYGISIPHGYSTEYVPVLSMNAWLENKGVIIWRDSGSITVLSSGLPRYKMGEIYDDPKNLSLMWDKAAEKIINKMLSKLNKQI